MLNLSDQYRVQPPATYTEAYFSTKGDFKIGFYCDGKDMKGFMSAGSNRKCKYFFDIKKFPDIKSILEDAIANIQNKSHKDRYYVSSSVRFFS